VRMTLGRHDTQHNDTKHNTFDCRNAELHKAECRFFIAMLFVFMTDSRVRILQFNKPSGIPRNKLRPSSFIVFYLVLRLRFEKNTFFHQNNKTL
jgi:hypothetical protein